MLSTSIQKFLLLLIGVSSALFCVFSHATPAEKPLFYQIDYKGQKAYLLGSVHVGKKDFYPLPDQIKQAFSQSKGIVVEAHGNEADLPNLLNKYGNTLFPMDKKTQEILTTYCKDKQALCAELGSHSPWLQSMQLALGRYSDLGYSTLYGVDEVLLGQAGQRPIYELESNEFQFKLLSSFSPQAQWQMVREAIAASDSEMLALMSAWRRGDKAKLNELVEEEMLRSGDTEMLEKLFWQRNQGMANKLLELMSSSTTKQPLFVIVGVGHLVGSKSVQSYLLSQGATSQDCWKNRCI
ncbi:TraB/GumN family protein [Shewanella sp.]|nr:TraB/GumN family protein [Shewanella sp.]